MFYHYDVMDSQVRRIQLVFFTWEKKTFFFYLVFKYIFYANCGKQNIAETLPYRVNYQFINQSTFKLHSYGFLLVRNNFP